MPAKTCLITGASRGIGLTTAMRFARQDYRIVAVARNEDDLTKAARQIRDAGGECEYVATDVASRDGARKMVDHAKARFGRIDVLVNNAGRAPLVAVDEMTPEDYAQTLAVNVDSVFHATQAVWPIMKAQKAGVIVNVSSLASVDPLKGFAVYGACKAWVNLFTKAAAAEGRPLGIRVYAVAPGAVETGMFRGLFPDAPADVALSPDDVAGVIESVCDERMNRTSGQTIFVSK